MKTILFWVIASTVVAVTAYADTFFYNSVGRLIEMNYPDTTVGYAYDDNGNITEANSIIPLSLRSQTMAQPGLGVNARSIPQSPEDQESDVFENEESTDKLPGTKGVPAWWITGETAIVDASKTPDNYAVANLGQLKFIAMQAKKYLDARLPANEKKAALEAKLNEFLPPEGVELTPAQKDANYRPLALGQLKAVAEPFYDWLESAGYDARAKLIQEGYPANWSSKYPWDVSTPTAVNYSPANLGQLKMVFSFEIDERPVKGLK